MVRTYGYNPSVRSNIRLDGSTTPLPSAETQHNDLKRSSSLPRYSAPSSNLTEFERLPNPYANSGKFHYNHADNELSTDKFGELSPGTIVLDYRNMDPAELERHFRILERERQRSYHQDLQRQINNQRETSKPAPWDQDLANGISYDRPRSVRSRYNNPFSNTQTLAYSQPVIGSYNNPPQQNRINNYQSTQTQPQSLQSSAIGLNRSSKPDDEPFWMKGSPQPTSGVRGSSGWLGRRRSASHSAPLPGQPMHQQSPFHDNLNRAFQARSNSQMRLHQQKSLLDQQIEQRRDRQQRSETPQFEYDPWGKGGGGAPVRDREGNTITDRARMQKTWNEFGDTNVPHRISPSQSYNNSSMNNGLQRSASMDPNQAYKDDLKRQIEDNKRLKEIERQQEKQRDIEDERNAEEYRKKLLQEEEEAKRKEKEKAQERERQQEVAEERAKAQKIAQQKASTNSGSPVKSAVKDDLNEELEWWEKKELKQEQSQNQPLLTDSQPEPILIKEETTENRHDRPLISHVTLEKEPSFDQTETSRSDIRRQDSADSVIIHEVKPLSKSKSRIVEPIVDSDFEDSDIGNANRPSSASQRNEGVMRQLSAMRERLTKEQMRVSSALERKQYGADLFSDEDTTSRGKIVSRAESRADSSRRKGSSARQRYRSGSAIRDRESISSRAESVLRSRSRMENDSEDMGEDLVKMIKSRRTLLPGVESDSGKGRPRSSSSARDRRRRPSSQKSRPSSMSKKSPR